MPTENPQSVRRNLLEPHQLSKPAYRPPTATLNESVIEDATVEWFGELGYSIGHGPHLTPGEPAAERDSFGAVVLLGRLREAIRRLNFSTPEERARRPCEKCCVETPSLTQTNRAFHRMPRDGMPVEHSRHDYLLPDVVAAIKTLPVVPTSLTVCTDDVFPDYLVRHGGVVDVLRRLIRYGLEPLQAIRCATINNAYRLKRDDLGWVAAGRRADLVVLDDLRELNVARVYTDGELVACDGALVHVLKPALVPLPTKTMKLAPLTRADFEVRVPELETGRAIVRAIKGARFTEWREIDVAVRSHIAQVPEHLSRMTVIHRHGRNPLGPQTAIIDGWGRWRGAYATSYAHDSHNLVVYGADPQEMMLAANAVVQMGGGGAVVKAGKVIARCAFPVAGLLSAEPPEVVASEHQALVDAAGEVVEWQAPYRTFKALSGQCLACNAGPHLTDLGLTDGTTRKIFGAFVRVG